MPFLDKDKIKVAISTEVITVIPGDTICGNVHIQVLEEVECTAIRLEVYCREHAEVRYSDGKNRYTAVSDFDHFRQTITLLGRLSSDTRKGGCTLQPGESDHAFQVILPATLPPSHEMKITDGTLSVRLFLRVVVDIPYGFDKKVEQLISVQPALPCGLYEANRNRPAPLGDATSAIYDCSCCCCFCCKHKGSSVSMSASMMPPFLILPAPGDNQPQRTHIFEPSNDYFREPLINTFTTRVMCCFTNNSTQDTITALSVSLSKHQVVTAKGHTKSARKQICCEVIEFGDSPILPGTTREFGVLLQLPDTFNMYTDCPNILYHGSTKLVIKVDTAGGTTLKHPIECDNAIYVAATLDGSNRVPVPPYSYRDAVVVQEQPPQ